MSRIARLPGTITVVIALIATLGGCSGSSTATEATATYPDVGIDLTSTVDPSTGAIVFPYDRLYPSVEESDLLSTAGTLTLAQCAQEQGVDWRASPATTYSTLYDSSTYFGVWTEEQASRFAFFGPATNADLVANGVVEAGTVTTHDGSLEQPDLSSSREIATHNSTLSEADLTIVTACAESDASEHFSEASFFDGPWNSKLAASEQNFDSLPEVEAIYDELDTCLEDAGLTPDPETPGMPVGWDVSTIDEEQIELALQVVACKTELDFVPRLADMMAELEAPILVEYADELLAERADLDEVLVEARAVIAAAQTAG